MLPSIFFSLNVENVRECCKAQWVCIDQNIAPCKSDLLLLGGFQSSGSGWFRLPQGWKPLGIDVQLASRSTCSHLLSSFHHWHWWSDEQKASALVFFFRFEAAECCSWVVPYGSGFVDGKSDCNFPSTVVFTVVVIRIVELVAFCFVCTVLRCSINDYFMSLQAPFNELVFSMATTDATIRQYFGVYSDGNVFTRKTFTDLPTPDQFTVSWCSMRPKCQA